ncbi:hypothetical protein DFH06DRAFT_1351735 [Mycena polygramma]|nr:hypothetical protein DFH06DRAFT_1351735 [Mycena polygramma]
MSLQDVVIERHELVSFLHNAAKQHKVFLVQGTTGAGTSLLAHQLQRYIHEREQARVTITGVWRDRVARVHDTVASLERKLLLSKIAGAEVDLAFNGPGKHWVLLDEAQSSYSDEAVQNMLLKNYTDHFIFVLFASHGRAGTPTVFTPDKRMGLRPTMNGSEGSAIPGLYFTKEEYQRLLEKQRDLSPTLAPDLQNYIFEVTNGHAGAMESIMKAVTVQSKSQGLTHMSLTSFFGSYPAPEVAYRSLSSGPAFARGLPDAADIGDIKFFKQLLVANGPKRYTGEHPPAEAEEAHRQGFVTREELDDEFSVEFDFPSPMHRYRISYLTTAITGHHPLPADIASLSLRDFVCHVDSLRPNVPNTQYPNEFYRAAHQITGGQVWLSPESDIFVSPKRWGIGFLRPGDGNVGRFAPGGAYYHWTETGAISEWTVLDCRTKSCSPKQLQGAPSHLALFESL